ncbi:Rid family detoxifying hydrolase [Buchnera aphidicola]|uniref:Uncharacterized protein n=1 Tax=Buchnera aphidicola (Aphis gossypii) TaxID=98785 RepID=A0A5J6ZDQ3_9GAMM|nr:Rid family detoxifying hydrolase [Buchnera aphidicola]QFQ32193.1 hypothetical protein FQV32_02075 [Buchnera aphidicola (Aphis gossypii)]UPT14719.1 hypothetical protein HWH54_02075 [Buchnera aphidicola (Aphis gossypii)]
MNIINTKNAPQPIGPYSQAIQFDNFLIISGQIPIDVKSGVIPESIDKQTYVTLRNIKHILEKSKYQVKNIVKITIFTTDLNKIQTINKIYENFFLKNKSSFPSRSCIEVKALPKNVKIEIEAMAYR